VKVWLVWGIYSCPGSYEPDDRTLSMVCETEEIANAWAARFNRTPSRTRYEVGPEGEEVRTDYPT
jgi:hypothetical protein